MARVRDPQRSGADEAIRELYAAHWTSMVRVAWLFLHDQGLAEDVTQDAFVAVHRRWDRLADQSRAVAYLRQCVVNGARSALRHRAVESRYAETAAGVDDHESAEETAVAQARHTDLVAAIALLPQRQKEVLVLRYFLDLDERSIADALGISRGAVKGYASRGLTALRDSTKGWVS